MTGLADQPLARLLDVIAAADPAPGGGTSAAVGAALAAALLEMAAGIALAGEGGAPDAPEGAPERAQGLRRRALELADRDISSYTPVLDVLRLPADRPDRAERLAAALSGASKTPLAIAEVAAETAALAAGVTAASSPSVRGDALAGVLIAEAATAAAASLVEINLAGAAAGRGDPDLARARDARRRAQEARDEALATLPRR
jgi:formiminotetrahydrofolate cyclodeaminase